MTTRKPATPASRTKTAGRQIANGTSKKQSAKSAAKRPKSGPTSAETTSARSTVSGPSHADTAAQAVANDALAAKMQGTQALAAKMPSNANKASEYGEPARVPHAGVTNEPDDPAVTG